MLSNIRLKSCVMTQTDPGVLLQTPLRPLQVFSCRPPPDQFLLLGLIDVSAAFSQVEVHLVSGVAALQLQQSCVLALVPQAALVAGEDGLTPQSDRHTNTRTVS